MEIFFSFCIKNDLIWFDKGYAINNAYYSPSKIDLEKERKKGTTSFKI
jgi:hypothetical protein